MINGITVLNESFILNECTSALRFAMVFCLICGCVLVAIGIVDSKLIMSLIGASLIVILFSIAIYLSQPSDIKEYQVTIDDSVSMVEFNERYEVIKVEGKIYTIREKDGE